MIRHEAEPFTVALKNQPKTQRFKPFTKITSEPLAPIPHLPTKLNMCPLKTLDYQIYTYTLCTNIYNVDLNQKLFWVQS